MFGQNEIVGRSFFKDAPIDHPDSLFITSLFFTIQGEGPFAGRPAFFVRLAKCNLDCSFCDTFFDRGTWMTFREIDAHIHMKLADYYKGPHQIPDWALGHRDIKEAIAVWIKPRKMVLVVTGGEPGLQKHSLAAFFDRMVDQFEYIQVETNGTFDIIDRTKLLTMVCSPKCNTIGRYIKPRAEVLHWANCLKFVVSADANSPYHTIPQWAHEWAEEWGKPIYVSPMNIYNNLPQKAKELRALQQGITLEQRSTVDEVISFWEPGLLDMKANQANHEYAASYALRHGYIFNMQMHLFASMA